MPFELATGDAFASHADVLVCPVNTMGVMGAGVARRVHLERPVDCVRYFVRTKARLLRPGDAFISGRTIFAATKDDWRRPSQLLWVEGAIIDIDTILRDTPWITVAAIPALGCGLGGLSWDDVRPLMERHFAQTRARVLCFPPDAAAAMVGEPR